MRAKLNLDKASTISKFVEIASTVKGDVYLTNNNHQYVVSAKSLLGSMYSLEWSDGIWLECDDENVCIKYVDYISSLINNMRMSLGKANI